MPRGMPSTGSSSDTCWPQAGSFALPSVEYNGSATHARGLSSTSPKRGDAALTTAPSSQGHAASSSYLPNSKQAETAGGYEIFVGDLSKNISDAALRAAFSSWATLIDARVMWDTSSGKSRGYGFVTFHSKLEAEDAIAVMNGEVMGYRPVRVNWATVKKPPSGPRTKPQVSLPRRSHAIALGMPPTAGAASGTPLSYQTVDSSAPLENTTIYVGNLPLTTSAGDLVMIFSRFSSVRIRDVRMHPNKGYAFVRLDTHENATRAIVFAAGHVLHNTRIKTGWAKDRLETNTRGVGSVSSTDASGTPPAGGGFCAAQTGRGQSPSTTGACLKVQTPSSSYPMYSGTATTQPVSTVLSSNSRSTPSIQLARLSMVAPPYASALPPPQVVAGYSDLSQQQPDLRSGQGW